MAQLKTALEIGEDVKVIVAEGNYLLHDQGEWQQIAELLDDSWFLDTSVETIRPRLIARHVEGVGRPMQQLPRLNLQICPMLLSLQKPFTRTSACLCRW